MESTRLSDFARGASGALAACAAMACLAFIPLQAHAASKSDLDHQNKKWWAWAEVGGFYDSEYDSELEVEVFLPIAQSARALLFLDLEGEFFEHDTQDGAIALGYREMFSNGWNLGLWAGPEVRRTREGSRFWRFDFGLEMLHPDYDFRLNAYTPFTGAQAASPAIFQGARHRPGEVVLEGNQIFMWNDFIGNGDGLEVPLWGFDGEVGVRVPLELAGIDPYRAELRLYGGGFYFDADEAMEEIAGPKARVELRFYDVIPNLVGSRLTAEYEYSYDDVRGDRHQAGARLRIPFGSPRRSWVAASEGSKAFAMVPVQPLTRQERRMLDALEREDVFTTRGKLEREQVGDYLTGVIFDRVAYVGPGDDLSEISADQGDYTLIIVNGTIVTTETEDIQGFQTVQGGQSTIPVFGVRSGRVVDFTAPGDPAFIDSTVDGDVLNLLGDHTHIAGLDINGNRTNGHGINVGSDKNADPIPPGTWNIVIDQTKIHDVVGDGVHLDDNNAHVLIFNETDIRDITGRAHSGIDLGDDNSDILISGVVIRDVLSRDSIDFFRGGAGIFMDERNLVTIVDTSIANISSGRDPLRSNTAGIFMNLGNEATITDVTIDNIENEGIRLDNENVAQITKATITNTGRNGLFARNLNTITLADSTIDNTGRNGIRLDGTNGGNTATITGTTISNAGHNYIGVGPRGGNGIFISNSNTVTISDSLIKNTDGDGIQIAVRNVVTISGVIIDGARDQGLEMSGIGGDPANFNTVTMNNTTFTGHFGRWVINFASNGNIISGDGNVFNGTFDLGPFCRNGNLQIGSYGFVVGPNCPP